MNKRFDIYKIDNIMIKAGYIFLFFFITTAYSTFSDVSSGKPFDYESLPVLLFLGGGAAAMLSVGYYYRNVENRVNSILKILTIASEVSLTELQRSTCFSVKSIEDALVIINKKLPYYYVLDSNSGMISDGRLKTRLVRVESCSGCGRVINQDFPVSPDTVPVCPYCGAPFKIEKWNSLKREAISDIQKSDPLRDDDIQHIVYPENFSWLLFIILLIFFWPAAIVYYIHKSRKSYISNR
ncbi:MAG TPA: hypothetical protein PK358_10080 [Spirochaetota bacterium]|nr:hypothetical protein [Spirochaetota bacterium]HPJ35172.1 hypothetical protein [Spirochaetota bacterium]